MTWAKTIAWRERLPLIGVHHLEGHLFAPTLEFADVRPPFVALLVSGGHTMLLDVPAWGEYRLLGQTRDDAAGEAFDKVGSLLGLEYPAGAALERLAATGRPGQFTFPRPLLKGVHRRRSVRTILFGTQDRRATRRPAERRSAARPGVDCARVSGCGDRGSRGENAPGGTGIRTEPHCPRRRCGMQ